MQIRWGKPPGVRRLAGSRWELSRDEIRRLKWMNHYLHHGRNAAFTCRDFGISRQCFYRWWRRYYPHTLSALPSPAPTPPPQLVGRSNSPRLGSAPSVPAVGQGPHWILQITQSERFLPPLPTQLSCVTIRSTASSAVVIPTERSEEESLILLWVSESPAFRRLLLTGLEGGWQTLPFFSGWPGFHVGYFF